MEQKHVTVGPEGRTAYHCVTGHPIAPDQLTDKTTVELLDTGAHIRVCREHGAPIAMLVSPKRYG